MQKTKYSKEVTCTILEDLNNIQALMVQGKYKLALFQYCNFLQLEHWPKFNTDTNINFLGGQNI